jgi:hypothetical protein
VNNGAAAGTGAPTRAGAPAATGAGQANFNVANPPAPTRDAQGNLSIGNLNFGKVDPNWRPAGNAANPYNIGGQGAAVNPNQGILIPLNQNGVYNPQAVNAVARQGLAAASTNGPGNDGGTWKLANGYGRDVLYGAAGIYGGQLAGAHTPQSQALFLAWPSTETGGTGSINGRRNYVQGNGSGPGIGPEQLTGPYVSTNGANNPFHSINAAIGHAEHDFGSNNWAPGQGFQKLFVQYNSGSPNGEGQIEGSRGPGGSSIAYFPLDQQIAAQILRRNGV